MLIDMQAVDMYTDLRRFELAKVCSSLILTGLVCISAPAVVYAHCRNLWGVKVLAKQLVI